jgi:hypothetical protein
MAKTEPVTRALKLPWLSARAAEPAAPADREQATTAAAPDRPSRPPMRLRDFLEHRLAAATRASQRGDDKVAFAEAQICRSVLAGELDERNALTTIHDGLVNRDARVSRASANLWHGWQCVHGASTEARPRFAAPTVSPGLPRRP